MIAILGRNVAAMVLVAGTVLVLSLIFPGDPRPPDPKPRRRRRHRDWYGELLATAHRDD